jgi:hypothetical protein
MALTTSTRSYIGKGKFYLKPRSGGIRRFVGNVRSARFAISEETKDLIDFTQGGGGVLDSVSRITDVQGDLEITEYSPENLALGLYGEVTNNAGGSAVSGEAHTVLEGSLTILDYMPDPDEDMVVKDVTDAITYVEDTDYTRTASGLIPIAGGGIDDDDVIHVSYTSQKEDLVEALVNSAQEFDLFFEGLNEVDSGTPVFVRAYRVKFSPTSGTDLVSDDFGALAISFKVLKDTAITGAGLSQYLQTRMVA